MKCEICNKRQKENTAGNLRYCQGHDMFEVEQEVKDLKFFYITATTHYDGLDYAHKMVACCESEEKVQRLADKEDFTHGNGIETQDVDTVREIKEEEYHVLARYIPELHCL